MAKSARKGGWPEEPGNKLFPGNDHADEHDRRTWRPAARHQYGSPRWRRSRQSSRLQLCQLGRQEEGPQRLIHGSRSQRARNRSAE